jgi:hypothetical protein
VKRLFFFLSLNNKLVLSCFLFRGMVWTRILRLCFYYCSTEQNSELFSLPRKGLERSSDRLFLFAFHGTELRVVFSVLEGFGTEFREFSVLGNNQNSVGNYHLFGLFRLLRNYFFVRNSQL